MCFRRAAICVLALMALSVASTHADDAPGTGAPPPPGMATAQQEYSAAMKKAETDFIHAQIAAKQKLLLAVQAAMKVATRAAKLDVANALNDQKTSLEREIADLKAALASGAGLAALGEKEPAGVVIDAKQGWQPVAKVKKGQIIHLKADGTWHTYGPDTFMCDAEGLTNGKETYPFTKSANPGALIGKLGGNVFLVGKAARIQAPEDGDLQLRINKRDDYLHDDSGQLKVTIVRGDGAVRDKSERRIP